MSFLNRFRQYFFTGLAIIAPGVVTIIILWIVFSSLDNVIGRFYENIPIVQNIPGLGFITLILIIMGAGVFGRLYLGRKLFSFAESIFTNLPISKSIYVAVKQIRDYISTNRKELFRDVVLVQFPLENSYSLGFTTRDAKFKFIDGKKLVPVFVPTTPNPTSGYLLFYEETDITKLALSIEDGIKIIVSGGVVVPDRFIVDSPVKPVKSGEPVEVVEV